MLAGPQYIWGPSGSKLLFTGLLIDMLCMDGGALADDVASGAPIYERESAHLPVACMGFKQGSDPHGSVHLFDYDEPKFAHFTQKFHLPVETLN